MANRGVSGRRFVGVVLGLGLLAMLTTSRRASAGQERVSGQVPGVLAERARERLRVLHDEADRLVLEERTILKQLRQLELARQIAVEERQAANADVVAAAAAVSATDARIRQLEAERDRARPALEGRLVDVYKLGRGRYSRLLLSMSQVRRIGQTSRTVAALAARDQAQLSAFQEGLRALGRAREALDRERRELVVRKEKARSAELAAARAIEARNALVRGIDEQRDLNARLAGELETAQRRLEAMVANAAPASGSVRLPIGPFRGALPWPVETLSDRARGPAWHKSSGRAGIDIAATEGTAVRAVHDGTVSFAGSFDGFGNLVIVDHGERAYTLYGDLMEMAVGRGVHVDRGSSIGRSGAAPAGTAGVYFELRVEGRPVDPVEWLNRLGTP